MKSKIIRNITMLVFSILFIYSNANSQWVQASGPSGITINSLIKSGNIILTGSERYGIYKSTNNGSTWINSSSGIENAKVTALIYLNGVFYAGLYGSESNKGIVKSTDNGESWTQTDGAIATN